MKYFNIQFIRNLIHETKTYFFYKPVCKKMGKHVKIIKPIIITPSCIKLGNSVRIFHHGRLQGVFNYLDIEYDPDIIIEDYVSIQQNIHMTCAEKIQIGRNTAIAANVTITDINHPYTDVSIAPDSQNLEISKVMIGEDCKIYNNAVILPGTKLGKHNIVGANSVVSGVFPDFCVISGIPARVIKKYDVEKSVWIDY